LETELFDTREQWQDYAISALETADRLANDLGVKDRLHLWPDKSLGHRNVVNRMPEPQEFTKWLNRWWGRISECPSG
jgi:hypothetical protein